LNIKFSRLHTYWDFPLGKCPQWRTLRKTGR